MIAMSMAVADVHMEAYASCFIVPTEIFAHWKLHYGFLG